MDCPLVCSEQDKAIISIFLNSKAFIKVHARVSAAMRVVEERSGAHHEPLPSEPPATLFELYALSHRAATTVMAARKRVNQDKKSKLALVELVDASVNLQQLLAGLTDSFTDEPVASDYRPVRCAQCGNGAVPLSFCTGCGDALYCGTACQHKAWPAHKVACRSTAAAAAVAVLAAAAASAPSKAAR